MGFFGTHASSLADLNLILITSGFLMLFQAIAFAKRKNFKNHIKVANTAVVLGCISFTWMVYSLLSHYSGSISMDFTGLIIASHVPVGSIALLTGVLFTFNKIKKTISTMRAGFLLWTLAVFSGFLLYLNNYVS